jgi:hypothetical protein
MMKNLFLLLSVLLLTDVYSNADESRNTAMVERLLPGEWKVVNMIVDPGKPFEGSDEDKAFFDALWKMQFEQSMANTTVEFRSDKTYVFQFVNNTKKKTVKGKWRLEENGDVLVLSEKRKISDEVKILLIDEEHLEFLYFMDDNIMLLLERVHPE